MPSLLWLVPLLGVCVLVQAQQRPNIVLVMADDQGWGQTGYYGHPHLRTPELDAMAAHGLRFDRFYAGASTCSPTRATVLTGRSNERCGVRNHGYALRLQEKTLPQALRAAGYATGHFGKWHLNGIRGPGVPIPAADDHNPGAFGFDVWVSTSNFFDRNPILARDGVAEEFAGDSSEVIVDEALQFMGREVVRKRPFLAVIWYGTPHSPWRAAEADRSPFSTLTEREQNHYGELVAMDRSIGKLRRGLRELGVAEQTLVWYCSDNGGLPQFGSETVGGLRGGKNTLFEGGLRVPAIVEWPAVVRGGRVTSVPASTLDIFPTVAEIVGLPETARLQPQDGGSLLGLLDGQVTEQGRALPFRHTGRGALVEGRFKLLTLDIGKGEYALYDLVTDPKETRDLSDEHPDEVRRMQRAFEDWNRSVEASVSGLDYPEGRVRAGEPEPRAWVDMPGYAVYFDDWIERPEYRGVIEGKRRSP